MLALLLLPARAALAQDCACTETEFEKARTQSQAIFAGQVLEVEAAPDFDDWVWATFKLETHWKGELEETVRVLTAATEDDCGIPFRPGESWLVYARDMGGFLWANRCWRAHRYQSNDPDLALLGHGIAPAGSWGRLKVRYR
jgi:hypothetical protein